MKGHSYYFLHGTFRIACVNTVDSIGSKSQIVLFTSSMKIEVSGS